jgi:predicted O-methyltransferase YrrM
MEEEIIKPIPLITSEAKKWLDSNLEKDMRIFEWGSGGSTLYFAKKVKQVVSVEHDKEWYEKIRNIIKEDKFKNIDYYFKEPVKPFINFFNKYKCVTFEKYKGLIFKRYVNIISKFPNHFFDLIFIDGRARNDCIKKCLKKLKKDGFIILDDSERKYYDKNILNKLRRIDFYEKDLFTCTNKQTSVWKN